MSFVLFSTELEKPAETSVVRSVYPTLLSYRKWRNFLLQNLYVTEQIHSLFIPFSHFTLMNILMLLVTLKVVILVAIRTCVLVVFTVFLSCLDKAPGCESQYLVLHN